MIKDVKILISQIKTLDRDALLKLLSALSDSDPPCRHIHPFLHRLADTLIGEYGFRILRCTTCAERVFVERIPISHTCALTIRVFLTT